jgi:hypothetical protein
MDHCTVFHAPTPVTLVPSFTAANLKTQTQGLELCSCIKKGDKIICVLAIQFNTHTHTHTHTVCLARNYRETPLWITYSGNSDLGFRDHHPIWQELY